MKAVLRDDRIYLYGKKWNEHERMGLNWLALPSHNKPQFLFHMSDGILVNAYEDVWLIKGTSPNTIKLFSISESAPGKSS